MSLNKKLMLFFFTITFSFCSGIAFLLFINVPVEGYLARLGASKSIINISMIIIIIFWIIVCAIATVFFYRRLSNEKVRSGLSIIMVIVLIMISVAVFLLLITTQNVIITRLQGTTTQYGDNYTFGAFPDEAQMIDLKKNGYTGVITLLNPIIPFEKVLLDKETGIGNTIGLPVYSYPMLPWVSENQDSIDKIKKQVKEHKGKYYIHCYLGKHRVNLVKQVLEDQSNPNKFDVNIYPSKLERGSLTYYKNSTLILGPYPTEEEWFNFILRGRIQEVISFLDSSNPEDIIWINNEKKICNEMDIKYINFPLIKNGNDYSGINDIYDYVERSQKKIYIHGFINDAKLNALDNSFKEKILESMDSSLPENIKYSRLYGLNKENIHTLKSGFTPVFIYEKLIIGIQPDINDITKLKELGISTFIYLSGRDNKSDQELNIIKKLVQDQGLNFLEVKYGQAYTNSILKEAQRDGNPTYLIVPEPSITQILRDLDITKLY